MKKHPPQLATRPDAPEALQQLVEIARNPAGGLPSGKDDFNRQQKDKKVTSFMLSLFLLLGTCSNIDFCLMEQVANYPVASRDDTIVLESSEPDPAAFQEQAYKADLLAF